MLVLCTECGHQISEKAALCVSCGAPTDAESVATVHAAPGALAGEREKGTQELEEEVGDDSSSSWFQLAPNLLQQLLFPSPLRRARRIVNALDKRIRLYRLLGLTLAIPLIASGLVTRFYPLSGASLNALRDWKWPFGVASILATLLLLASVYGCRLMAGLRPTKRRFSRRRAMAWATAYLMMGILLVAHCGTFSSLVLDRWREEAVVKIARLEFHRFRLSSLAGYFCQASIDVPDQGRIIYVDDRPWYEFSPFETSHNPFLRTTSLRIGAMSDDLDQFADYLRGNGEPLTTEVVAFGRRSFRVLNMQDRPGKYGIPRLRRFYQSDGSPVIAISSPGETWMAEAIIGRILASYEP